VRVSLVVPPFDYGRMLYGLLNRRSFHNAVPLGILNVGACLREAGHEVHLLDAPGMGIDEAAVVGELRKFRPDAIGVTATSIIWEAATSLCTALKQAFDVPIFVGGPHPSLYPEWCLETNLNIDAACYGEGEETGVELVDALEAGRPLRGVPGICFRSEHGTIEKNQPRIAKRELDAMPLPAYDLADLSLYSAPPMRVRHMPAVYMEMFRGCAYAKCSYCTSASGLKNRYRRHSPEVAAEKVLAMHQRFGVQEVAFVDDDFVVGKDWIYNFCGELRKRGNPISWSCYVRASQVDESIFQAMAAARCHQILVGMEVLDNEVLREELVKDLTVASAGACIRAAHKANISVIGLFMVGVKNTTPESVEITVDTALAQELDIAVFSLYRPPPGSPAYDELGWGPQDYIDCFKLQKQAVYVPDTYQDLPHVEETFRRAYRRFYTDPGYIGRTARKFFSDPIAARNIAKGAVTLADQFRPKFLNPAASEHDKKVLRVQ
jgi:anaerobic magnesium-protoporphyrin IX monomethyl ester cyclase